MKYIFITQILIFLFSLSNQSKPNTLELNAAFKKIKEDNSLLGLSAIIIKNKEIYYESYSGYEDLQTEKPVTEDTIFRIASISKSFGVTALMTLYDQGKVDLDLDISEYLGFTVRNPNYPDTKITLRQIFSHTSSLNDGSKYDDFLTDTYAADYGLEIPRLSEVFSQSGKYYTEDTFQKKEPGKFFLYCNLNFVIVGTIVEQISGIRFDRYVKQYVLEPLDIDTSFNIDDLSDTQIKNVAGLYIPDGKGGFQEKKDNYHGQRPMPKKHNDYDIGSNGAIYGPQGGLYISARLLKKYMIMHFNEGKGSNGNRIIKKETAQMMHDITWEYDGTNGEGWSYMNAYGFAFHISLDKEGYDRVYKKKTVKGHTGDAYGLISNMWYDVDTGNGHIFATNGCSSPFQQDSPRSKWFKIEGDILEVAEDTLYNGKYNQESSTKWGYVVLGISLALIILGGVGYFIFYKKKKSQEKLGSYLAGQSMQEKLNNEQ